MKVNLKINARQVRDDVEPRTLLVDYLRDKQDLTSVHVGCEVGACGACAVLIDEQPSRACLVFAVACEGSEVQTLDGLKDDPIISVLRKTFHACHGLQCGYCTPAMLITARDLIVRHKADSPQQIRLGLSGSICRCTGYTNIVSAIERAARIVGSGSDDSTDEVSAEVKK
jgi:aerobic carbon-monoxide dehydrogenase small subunit